MINIESFSNDVFNEEPYVGMPISRQCGEHTHTRSSCDGVDSCPLAMAYVPWQVFRNTYEPSVAFVRGTIFPELDLPWEVR